jgi:hypothetical protein
MRIDYQGVIVPVSTLLPLGAGVYAYRRLEKPHKIILFYLVIAGITDGAASYMAHHRTNNLWLLHIYTAIETVLLVWFYRIALVDERIKKGTAYVMVVFPLVCLANIIWGQGILRFNTYTRPVEALIVIYLGLIYFFERSQAPVDPGMKVHRFLSWFNTGILLYFSFSFLLFLFFNYLHPNSFLSYVIMTCHATFVLIMYLLFMIGFLKCHS